VEGLLEELGEAAGEEADQEQAAHGLTPFPEAAG
jgi:hypothetical protein